jgi:asparagine synthase (glutamine-hydrolysing)
LGHVRLSIIDLTPSGDQPFHDEDIHAVVNGELYDYEHYRTKFAQEYNFKGNSDCEIVIAMYRYYGIEFLSHLRGEFALVLWDAKRKLFFAARDRYGIKSLYYTIVDGQLLVATEMKSFLPLGWKPEWSVRKLRDKSWEYGANTFFENVYSVCAHLVPCSMLLGGRPQAAVPPIWFVLIIFYYRFCQGSIW